jgi:hypothetical protein
MPRKSTRATRAKRPLGFDPNTLVGAPLLLTAAEVARVLRCSPDAVYAILRTQHERPDQPQLVVVRTSERGRILITCHSLRKLVGLCDA